MVKKEFRSVYKFVFGFVCIGVALWSCSDTYTDSGSGILPVGDIVKVGKIIVKDSIKSYTFTDEIQRTDEPAYNLLGTFNDPIFGKTTADFACQFRIAAYPDFSKNAKIDSMILYFYYKQVFGDVVTPQRIRVYELTSDLDVDLKYYQNIDLKGMSASQAIGDQIYLPIFKLDSLTSTYGSTKANPKDTVIQEVGIKIDLTLANKLMALDSLTLSDNDKFMKAFKGLYVEAGDLNQGGALMRIAPNKYGGPYLVFHYHNDEEDSLNYSLVVNSATSARVSRFNHNYSGTAFASNQDKETVQDSLIYLQTTGGLRSKIYINNWIGLLPDNLSGTEKIAINQAELIFKVDNAYSDTTTLVPPNQLVLTALDADGSEYLPADQAFSTLYFGGVYNSSDSTYRFNIAKHMQQVYDNRNIADAKIKNYGFFLSTSFRSDIYRRVVLKGAGSKTGIRMDLTYSIIK